MIRLIASDMDGTLLDENSLVPSETFLLIRQLWLEGVRFCVSSGRPYQFLREIFAPVADEMDFVCSNGTQVVIGGKVVARELFSYASIMRLKRFCEDFDCLHLIVREDDAEYLLDDDPAKVARFRPMAEEWGINLKEELPPPTANLKLGSVISDNLDANIMDIAYILGLEMGREFTFAPTDPYSIDVIPAGVSKATGIKQVMDHYDVYPEETMAYGDSMNDYQIMREVGHPVGMANAQYGLKQVCERIIETNVEHGVQRDMARLLDQLRREAAEEA